MWKRITGSIQFRHSEVQIFESCKYWSLSVPKIRSPNQKIRLFFNQKTTSKKHPKHPKNRDSQSPFGGEDWHDWPSWLVDVGGIPTPLKSISQLGWLSPIYGKIKFMFQTTDQPQRCHFLGFCTPILAQQWKINQSKQGLRTFFRQNWCSTHPFLFGSGSKLWWPIAFTAGYPSAISMVLARNWALSHGIPRPCPTLYRNFFNGKWCQNIDQLFCRERTWENHISAGK